MNSGGYGFRIAIMRRGFAPSVPEPAFYYGWDEGIDLGKTFNYVVDAHRGDDANSGTSIGQEFATIQAAVDAAVAAGTAGLQIKVRGDQGQTYTELVDLTGFGGAVGNHNTIGGYGTEKPKISAFAKMTGFVSCTSGDAAILGANWANCYKVSAIDKSSLATGTGTGLNLFERDIRVDIATDRADNSDLFWPTWIQAFHGYGSMDVTYGFVSDPDPALRFIETITHSKVFLRYTEAQLLNAFVNYYRVANNVTQSSILSYNGSDTISISPEFVPTAQYAYYSLTNIGPAIKKGQYVFSDNGDGTISVYIWPNDPANLTENIQYAARKQCIDISTANYTTLEGLECFGSAGDVLYQGAAIACATSSIKNKTGITLRHCFAHDTLSANASGYAAIHLSQIKDLVVSHVSVKDAMGTHGIMNTGRDSDDHASGALIEFCRVERSNESPYRNFGQKNAVIAHCHAIDCGRDTHANKTNAYQGIRGFLWWGIKFENCHGYIATQRSSDVTLAFCDAPIYPRDIDGDGRSYQDQQKFPIPVANSDYFIFNNRMLPQVNVADNAAINLTNRNNDANYYIRNNIAHGITAEKDWNFPANGYAGVEYNIITNLVSSQTLDDFSDTNVILEDLDQVVADHKNQNWTPPAGSPILTTKGWDMTSIIDTLQVRYPQFKHFDKDVNFKTIDWSIPFIGPDSQLAFTHKAPPQISSLIVAPDKQRNVLTWAAPRNNGFAVNSYKIEVDTGSGYSAIADGTVTGLSFAHKGLTDGASYSYRVTAVNSFGQGQWSTAVSGTPRDALYSEDFSTDTTSDFYAGAKIVVGYDGAGQRMSVTGGTDGFEGVLSEIIAVEIGVEIQITVNIANDSAVAVSLQSGIPSDTNLYGLTSFGDSVGAGRSGSLSQTITPTDKQFVFNSIFRGTDNGGVFYIESVTIVEA